MAHINSTKQSNNHNVNGSTAVSYTRNGTAARAADFRKMLFRAGFERIEAQPLASALAEMESLIKNKCEANSEDNRNDPYATLRTSWDDLETSLQSAKLGVLDRIGFAILDFFGRFFSNAKEQAREFLLKQTDKDRSDLLQCLATLAQDATKIGPRPQAGTGPDEDISRARELLLKGLTETMGMGRVLTDQTWKNMDDDQVVEDLLEEYQLVDHAPELKSLLADALDLLRAGAKNDAFGDNGESGEGAKMVPDDDEDARQTEERASGATQVQEENDEAIDADQIPDDQNKGPAAVEQNGIDVPNEDNAAEGQQDEAIDTNGETENPNGAQESISQNGMNIPGGDDAAGEQYDEAIHSNGDTENPDSAQESTKKAVVDGLLNKAGIEQLHQSEVGIMAALVHPAAIDSIPLAENMEQAQAFTWDLGGFRLGQNCNPKGQSHSTSKALH